ncbi:class I SAM-dependent methyltransferase [Actinomadura kijaniata]|uniref:SAM-dependent methyltransferase n=1 Tax=Actinomadura namibiensis TaxID=182080 RepID=A0A7W3LN65_ACTNM|nr:class I SAM-dependent methyltransferase [Actinomadura namibiensis]MBA8951213.1 SAM-dependent methyltransferase [Actinomadura namibiensis]
MEGVFGDDWVHFFGELLDRGSDSETDLIWRLLDVEPGMEVLDLGCGYGRIANHLAGRGCRVTGLDVVPALLDRARRDAREQGLDVAYVEGDMRNLEWTGRFDRVVCWFTTFGYFDDEGNRRVLREVARALRPGGRLLLETMNRDWLLGRFQHASVVERDGDRIVDRHRWEPLTGRLVTERTLIRDGRVKELEYFLRLFPFTELRDWLLEAGFTAVDGLDEGGDPLTLESSRMIVVATR